MTRALRLLVPCLLAVAAVGCGAGSHTTTVHGTATYRDEPLEGGVVTFYPQGGRPLLAALSENGEYTLQLPPGEYTVTVNRNSELPPGFKEGDPLPPPSFVLPPEYSTRSRSRLTASVTGESRRQTIDFDLQ